MTTVPSVPTAPGAHDETGLSTEEAGRLLAQYGLNEAAEPKPNAAIAVLGHFWAPAPWMLAAAVLLQALIGEYLEAAVIAGLLVINAALSFVQGRRAEAALAALKTRRERLPGDHGLVEKHTAGNEPHVRRHDGAERKLDEIAGNDLTRGQHAPGPVAPDRGGEREAPIGDRLIASSIAADPS